jgi:hypothetical protein
MPPRDLLPVTRLVILYSFPHHLLNVLTVILQCAVTKVTLSHLSLGSKSLCSLFYTVPIL